jgi:hypothetical protein
MKTKTELVRKQRPLNYSSDIDDGTNAGLPYLLSPTQYDIEDEISSLDSYREELRDKHSSVNSSDDLLFNNIDNF